MKNTYGPHYKLKDGVLFIHGSDHWLEWLHHITPFARRREIRWAMQIVDEIKGEKIHAIAGHSIGGTQAIMVAESMIDYYFGRLRLYTYGAKRPPWPFTGELGKHYRIKGDPVPFLPPWRKRLRLITLDYGKMGPVEAHGPKSYHEQMEKDGVKNR